MLSLLVLVVLASAVSAGTLPQYPNGRIVGGEDTTIEKYPYQISLEFLGSHMCGGSIISEYYVITAAHCASAAQYLRVRAGTSNRGNGGSVHEVTEVHFHEKFNYNRYLIPINDIAILRVKEPFVFDETRQPIKLYDAGEEALAGLKSVITGWGSTDDGTFLLQLQTVAIPIIPKQLCNTAYKAFEGLPKGQICAAYYGVGGKDACQGDDGGPLAINGRLAGITSWGNGCAQSAYPGVYTEVAAYRDWINKTAKLN